MAVSIANRIQGEIAETRMARYLEGRGGQMIARESSPFYVGQIVRIVAIGEEGNIVVENVAMPTYTGADVALDMTRKVR
jgi:hypothetical protein